MLAALACSTSTALEVSHLFEHESAVVLSLAQFRRHFAGRDEEGCSLLNVAAGELEDAKVVVRLRVAVVVDQCQAKGASRQRLVSGALWNDVASLQCEHFYWFHFAQQLQYRVSCRDDTYTSS